MFPSRVVHPISESGLLKGQYFFPLFCGIHYYGIFVVIGVKIHITVYFINYLMYCSRFRQQYFVLAILKRTWSALCGR